MTVQYHTTLLLLLLITLIFPLCALHRQVLPLVLMYTYSYSSLLPQLVLSRTRN